MSRAILFLCPHHAAKSVMAAAYFGRLAEAHGLDVKADSAGTEPSEAVNPAVAALLLAEGIDISGHQPRRVTVEDLTRAERVISMGCSAAELGLLEMAVEHWHDVPLVSQDLPGAQAAILRHVEQLIDELQGEKV